MVYEHGHLRLVQLGRANLPVPMEKKLGTWQGYPKTYKEAKEMFAKIPDEKRNISYISASRIFLLYPPNATKTEVLKALEVIINDIKLLWEEETAESTE